MLFERIKLESDEEIICVVRAHWWIIFSRTLATVVVALAPLSVFIIIPHLPGATGAENTFTNYKTIFSFLYLLWILGCWIIIANAATNHYLDLWAVTNRRIVAIDQQGFFRRRLSSFRLERLQDMNIMVTGIIPTLLNYGTIEAQTAGGSNEEFISHNMPDPRGLKALIIHAADVRQRESGVVQQLNQEGL